MKMEHRVRWIEAPGRPGNDGDRVTQAVMARLGGPPAPIEELAAQLIARAELSRTRRRSRRPVATVPYPADPAPRLQQGAT